MNQIFSKKIISIIVITIITVSGYSQEAFMDNVYKDDIKSVRLFRSDWNLSYPVIKLNSDETLQLQFDQLGSDIESYYYTLFHCTKDWHPSDIFQSEYLDGFYENPVENYELSFNTTTEYVHYSLTFPNQDINILKSGNYIIKVFSLGEPDNPVLIKRFMVSEDAVTINADALRPKAAAEYSNGQQIEFKVEYQGLNIMDPYRNSFAVILQNGRWDKATHNLKPSFLGDKSMIFNDINNNYIFDGGSEFRYFDIKSNRFHSEFIRAIEFENGSYHVYLYPSEDRSGKQYFYHQDFNGKYYIAVQEGRDHAVEADYVYVYFTLPSPFPVRDADVFIAGEMTNWCLNDNYKMRYNQENARYEATLLLKQGWYNYQYIVKNRIQNKTASTSFENNHFETENDYMILFYLSQPSNRYDRLLGVKIINTLNNQ